MNRLPDLLPYGAVADSKWLTECGLDRRQQSRLVRDGYATRLRQGVYARMRGDAHLQADMLILSMQNLLGIQCHVGGASALDAYGLSHYLSLGQERNLHVYGRAVPSWCRQLKTEPSVEWHGSGLFSDSDLGVEAAIPMEKHVFSPDRTWRLMMSSKERAILELLEELPTKESFHVADMAFQSLTGLRPRLVTRLLEDCRSVKAKRLFMVFSERHNHAWLKHVRTEDVDFGTGKRHLVDGGVLDKKYKITIPLNIFPD